MTSGPDKSRKALGKGLSALLPARTAGAAPAPAHPAEPAQPAVPTELALDQIHPNPTQPRTNFQPERLEELAQSIRANGIIQPLIVRRDGAAYELVAGERRWRAARIAGLAKVPVVIQDFAQERLLELALIENIQREDLNPLETAHAFDRLVRELGLSHEEIGRRTGKDRSSIANSIRLLKLPKDVQRYVAEGALPMGQARALLALPDEAAQIQMAAKAVEQSLSTRQVEALVRKATEPKSPETETKEAVREDPNVRAAIDEMQRTLGTRVRIVAADKNRGRIEIDYFTQEELDRIYSMIVK
jgi:ParB family transcriptional regulator, chromosome partitioning protein